VDGLDGGTEPDLHPAPLEEPPGVDLRAAVEAVQQVVAHLRVDHPHGLSLNRRDVPDEDLAAPFGHRSGELDARGAAAGDHEGEAAVEKGGRVPRRPFERLEHARAKVYGFRQGLQEEGVLVHAGDSKIAGGRASCEQQVVEGQTASPVEAHDAILEVDGDGPALPESEVVLTAGDGPHLPRDLGHVEARRSHLVIERSERVVVVLIDDRDLGVGLRSALAALSPANPAPTITTCGL